MTIDARRPPAAPDATGVPRSGEIDRSLIGTATDPFVVEVEKGAIRRFAEAIEDANPLYHDEAFAVSRGFRSLVAPPTFATTFRFAGQPLWMRGLEDGRILAGEQSFRLARPVLAGDVLTCRIHLLDVEAREGRSGKIEFIVQEMRAEDRAGAIVVVNGRTIVYRAPGRYARG